MLGADKRLAKIRLPCKIQEFELLLRKGYKRTGTDEKIGYRYLAEFRRKHPTDSTEKSVVDAINQLTENY